ncbi:DinB family protein [Tumebacillus permanentifrigoris]|uniref:Putative damage-inducible protein DinB n=1 Tax=Tumebacillus permanentifrigoris TaxID=378543 RepID=A0A316D7W1_9BACL|nr:DinB family protein [Tumebacillus permanentifrigoris]PWK12823.1 putative damage-inducible protein DinB [Tumebacillus permanentifrigoris]
MLKLFEYNWQVRKDWFDWCDQVLEEELLKKRTGGLGSILYTLYHIVYVEYGWISLLQGKEPKTLPSPEDASVQTLRDCSARCHAEIAPFIYAWNSSMEDNRLSDQNEDTGEWESYKYGEIIRHVIAHEIHHIGQLSIWSREIGKPPVTANLIRRGLFD